MPTTNAYRAAIWTDGQSELALTLPEHAALSDAELMQLAAAEIASSAPSLDLDQVSIGEWAPQ